MREEFKNPDTALAVRNNREDAYFQSQISELRDHRQSRHLASRSQNNSGIIGPVVSEVK